MSVSLLMTITAQLFRQTNVASDGIGGYKVIYSLAHNITCKIDARSEKDVFEDDILHKEVTNIIYTKSTIYEKDIISVSGVSYQALQVIYFKDVLGLGNDHYKALCKRVVE